MFFHHINAHHYNIHAFNRINNDSSVMVRWLIVERCHPLKNK